MPVRRQRLMGGGQMMLDLLRPEEKAERVRLPVTRAECRGPGVCPKFGCRYNITLDVTEAGAVVVNAPANGYGRRPVAVESRTMFDDVADQVVDALDGVLMNCALDIAESFTETDATVAARIGVSDDQVAAVLRVAMAKIRKSGEAAALVELMQARQESADQRQSTDYGDAG